MGDIESMTATEAKKAIKADMTLGEFSEHIGYSRSVTSQVLSGCVTSQPVLAAIEKYLEVPPGSIKVESKHLKRKYDYSEEIKEERRGIKVWKCRCPSCGKPHKMKLNWTGRNPVPPKLCKSCRVADRYEPEVSEYARRYL
jgi:hypothetical protein